MKDTNAFWTTKMVQLANSRRDLHDEHSLSSLTIGHSELQSLKIEMLFSLVNERVSLKVPDFASSFPMHSQWDPVPNRNFQFAIHFNSWKIILRSCVLPFAIKFIVRMRTTKVLGEIISKRSISRPTNAPDDSCDCNESETSINYQATRNVSLIASVFTCLFTEQCSANKLVRTAHFWMSLGTSCVH